MNACRQTGLRGADRREMASTCYIAGAPLLSTPQLHDTHTHTHIIRCVCSRVLCPQSRPVLPEAQERDGCPLFSLPLSSSIPLLTHTNPSIPPLLFPFDLSLPCYLFRCSLLFSLHLSSSSTVSICSLLILLISLRLSFSLRKSGVLLWAQLRDSCPQHFLSLSSALALLSPSLFLSFTPKYQ